MKKLNYDFVEVIDSETGVIKQRERIHKNERIEVVREKTQAEQERDNKFIAMENQKSNIRNLNNKNGGFIGMCYISNEILFNEISLSPQNVSRLIYLATHIDYNNRQENMLIKYNQHKEITPMTRKDIAKIMNLSDKAFRDFLKEMKEKELLFEVDKKFYISNKYFSKGSSDFKNYTRLYIKFVRELYENCTPKQHKTLGKVYQLIPFIHYEKNLLVSNPNEKDFTKLHRLTLKDICQLLGVSSENGNDRKLKQELLKFHIVIDGVEHYLFNRITIENAKGKTDYFAINPSVTWRGKNLDSYNETLEMLIFH